MNTNIQLKKICILILAGYGIASPAANTTEVCKENIIFHCSFDKTLTPQIAKGSKVPVKQGKVEFKPGKEGDAVKLGKGGVSLGYKSFKNIDPEIGTIAFWIKPVNWQPEKIAAKDLVYPFFNLSRGMDSMDLFISQRKAWANLNFALNSDLNKIPYQTRALHYSIGGVWNKGQWAHLAICWDFKFKGRIALYFNGKLISEKSSAGLLKRPFFKRIADIFRLGASPHKHCMDATILMDELYIYNTVLSSKSINQLITGTTSPAANVCRTNTIMLPKSGNPPIVDGIIDTKEWQQAVSVAGMINLLTKKYAAIHASFKAAYSNDGIFIAFNIPNDPKKPFLAVNTKRDGQIWLDDSFEVWLQSPDGNVYQFIANSAGGVFDRKNQDSAWNSRIKYKSKVSPQAWTSEMFIPWSDLSSGIPNAGDNWKINFCVTDASPSERPKFYTWAWLNKGFSDTACFAKINFVNSGCFIQVPELSISPNGMIKSGAIGLSPQKQDNVNVLFAVAEAGTKADKSAVEVQYTNKYFEEKEILKLQPAIPASCKFDKILTDSEFSLFNVTVRDLKDNRILYQTWTPFELKLDLQLKCRTYPSKKQIVVEFFDYKWTDDMLSKLKAKLIFMDNTGKVLHEKILKIRQPGPQHAVVSFAGCPPGRYKVKVDIIDAQKGVINTAAVPWRLPENQLKKWRLGQGTVPKPFTPLQTTAGQVSMTERVYKFSDNMLPVQFVARNKELLEDKIRLTGFIDKKNCSLKTKRFEWIKKAPDQAEYQASGELTKTLKVKAHGRIDFDGFMWIDLKLTPKTKENISRLYLEIPFKKEAAPYLCYNTGQPGHASHAFWGNAPEKGVIPFFPFVWLGDLDKGLTWFAESPENWHNQSPGNRIELFKHGNRTVLRIKLIDKATSLTKPTSYRFGLMATPVKPLPKHWWLEFFMSSNPQRHRIFRNADLIPNRIFQSSYLLNRNGLDKGYNQLFNPFPDKGMRDVKNKIKQDKTMFHRKRQLPWPQYSTCDYTAQYDFYKDEWMIEPFIYVPNEAKIKCPPTFRVCMKSSFKEALGSYARRLVEELGFSGIYFDTGANFFCANTHHGCGYVDDSGKLCQSMPIVEIHDFMKDIFLTGKTLNPNFYLINLTNGAVAPPLISFNNAVLSGEEWNGHFNGDYTDCLSLDIWKLKFNPEIWGVLNIALPARGLQAQTKEGKKFATRLLGTNTYFSYILLAGTPTWIAYLNDDRCEEILTALHRFGAFKDKAKFSPFWKVKKEFKLSPAMPFSFYQLGNDYLVVLAGLEAREKLETLSGVDFYIVSMSDFLTGEKIAVTNNKAKITVPAKNFRLIKISTTKR